VARHCCAPLLALASILSSYLFFARGSALTALNIARGCTCTVLLSFAFNLYHTYNMPPVWFAVNGHYGWFCSLLAHSQKIFDGSADVGDETAHHTLNDGTCCADGKHIIAAWCITFLWLPHCAIQRATPFMPAAKLLLPPWRF